jgi:hypothetical protein
MDDLSYIRDAADAAPPFRAPPPPTSPQRVGAGCSPYRITPTPFVWRDPATIPPRDWIYGHHLIRKYVSLVVAPGAAGKTSLIIGDAVALASGRDILGTPVYGQPKRAWLWNLEDPRDEIERRVIATAMHHGIAPEVLAERLFVDSGRDTALCVGTMEDGSVNILHPVVDALVEALTTRQIDVLVVDPFVSSHTVSENDNNAIDAVAKAWGVVAERANCAILLVHHLRKLGGAEATAEAARGAGALVAAARSVRVLNRMTEEEASRAGLETHRRHFRVFDDKANLAPAAADADWFQMIGVELGNGDNVGVVARWRWPNPLDDVSVADLVAVQKAIDGKGYRANVQAQQWVGRAIADVLGLDIGDAAAMQQVKGLLRIWLANGALVITTTKDGKGTERPIVEVGRWAA